MVIDMDLEDKRLAASSSAKEPLPPAWSEIALFANLGAANHSLIAVCVAANQLHEDVLGSLHAVENALELGIDNRDVELAPHGGP